MPRYILVAMALTILTVPAYAQNDAVRVGTLMALEGDISLAVPDAEPSALKKESAIHMRDVIQTGPGARALILLIDDTEFTLGENAQFTVDEYVFDEAEDTANKGRYSVLRGAFLYASGLVAKKENPDVSVNTPYGSIGIRGTSFWGGEIDGEYGVLVTDGQVNVQTDRGRITVNKEQGTMLRARTSIPSRAGAWEKEKIDRAVQTIAMKDSTAIRERVTQYAETQKQLRTEYKDNRAQQTTPDIDKNAPLKRIDNAPRTPETKTDGSKTPVATTPEASDLNKPFSEETAPRNNRKSNAPAESLLKAAPTNTAPSTAAPVPEVSAPKVEEKPAEKTEATPAPVPKALAEPSGAPQVELPALGDNEAHTNELKEQQHLQKAPATKGSAGAL